MTKIFFLVEKPEVVKTKRFLTTNFYPSENINSFYLGDFSKSVFSYVSFKIILLKKYRIWGFWAKQIYKSFLPGNLLVFIFFQEMELQKKTKLLNKHNHDENSSNEVSFRRFFSINLYKLHFLTLPARLSTIMIVIFQRAMS